MLCRISDEYFPNPWEGENYPPPERTIDDFTLAQLIGDNYSVWLGKNKQFGFVLEIENDEGKPIIENCLHPDAAESLAYFCRSYLRFYDKLEVV